MTDQTPTATDDRQPTPDQLRCSFTWTPDTGTHIVAPELRCTNRGDVAHHHHWSSYEHDLWERAQLRAAGA